MAAVTHGGKLSHRFRVYGDSLRPSDEKIRSCNQVIEYFTRQLTSEESSLSIDRIRPGGGFAKGTALDTHFDLDLVIYINVPPGREYPEYKAAAIPMVHEIIGKMHGVHKISKSHFNVSGTINDMEFDVIFAKNAATKKEEGKSIDDEQFETVFQEIISSPDPAETADLVSHSLDEAAVNLVKEQTAFVHSVIRLCKLWDQKCVHVHSKIEGRSSTIELIAIEVGRKTQASEDTLLAFRTFLGMWMHPSTMDVKILRYFEAQHIPEENQHAPVVLDPVNPYINRMEAFRPHFAAFSEAARKTISALDKMKNKHFHMDHEIDHHIQSEIFV